VRRRIEIDPSAVPVRVPIAVLNEVFAHAREAFPEECCGLITGVPADRYRHVVRCRNDMTLWHQRDPESYPRDGKQGFYMNEQDYLRAEDEAGGRGELVTCVYHSHVECPSYFSEMDQEFAEQPLFPFPDAEHLVVAVIGGRVGSPSLFRRAPGRGGFCGWPVAHGEQP
jgi:proteasome lid subunit RPN8/RPN11